MKTANPYADFFVPDATPQDTAQARTTHLGIGAHQDDLEFMALHGILECIHQSDQWFGGITCTDGAGSARSGHYADFSDEDMKAVRVREQQLAATIGQFSFMAQLGFPSAAAKERDKRQPLVQELVAIIQAAQPEVIYTHNPFDKHATHIGVLLAVLDAVKSLPEQSRPQKLIGCEGWRGLDWLPDPEKLLLDVSAHGNLAAALSGVFDSQIAGGKRYDLAVEGRRLANSTFFNAHTVDQAERIQYAIDLTPLIASEIKLADFMQSKLDLFHQDLFGLLNRLQ